MKPKVASRYTKQHDAELITGIRGKSALMRQSVPAYNATNTTVQEDVLRALWRESAHDLNSFIVRVFNVLNKDGANVAIVPDDDFVKLRQTFVRPAEPQEENFIPVRYDPGQHQVDHYNARSAEEELRREYAELERKTRSLQDRLNQKLGQIEAMEVDQARTERAAKQARDYYVDAHEPRWQDDGGHRGGYEERRYQPQQYNEGDGYWGKGTYEPNYERGMPGPHVTRPQTARGRMTQRGSSGSRRGPPPKGSVEKNMGPVPFHQRYGYYKLYGLAGAGAKTSYDHNNPLGSPPRPAKIYSS